MVQSIPKSAGKEECVVRNKIDNQTVADSADSDGKDETTASLDKNGSQGEGNVDSTPSMEDNSNNSSDAGMRK